jgi:nucleoside-diphosphate-sugar epimerase
MRVLVTGHHGYIGAVLAPILANAGHEVVGLDTFYYRDCDFGSDAWEPAQLLSVDVRDADVSWLDGIDAVVHLAALSNDPVGDLNASLTHEINGDASVALARAAKQAGVGRYVFASSCSMYGASDTNDLVNEDAPLRPLTAYAESKVDAEGKILALADDSFATVSMRNATAYGVSPRLRLDIVLNNLVAWAHTTGAIRLQSDGSAWRPLVHIRDISKATLALLDAPADAIRGCAFNIGTDEQNYTIRQLAEIVRQRLPDCEIEYAEGASPDTRSYRVDFSRFHDAFPDCEFEWTAERGADELATAYEAVGLTADELSGERYLRLGRIKHLLADHALTDELRWTAS